MAQAPDQLRLLGLVEGDPQGALSGVAGKVFDALSRHAEIVARVDYSPRGWRKAALAAATVGPSKPTWRARYHTSPIAHRMLSRELARRREAGLPAYDVALQVHGWVLEQPKPYTLYIDQTRMMADRGWPSWIPLRPRERSVMLERERLMYRRAAHVFAMGQPTRESLWSDYGIEEKYVTVVGGGLNLPSLPDTRELPSEPRILFVGRDFMRKGGDGLLRAFHEVREVLPAAELHIVGTRAGEGQRGVVSHGKISNRAELASLYRSARVFAMPSRYEPWGLVFPEAMAYGVACVGTDVQSIPEILGSGSAGLIVPAGDDRELARALIRLLRDDELALRLGEAARERVRTCHTWEHVAERMLPALKRIRWQEGVRAGRTR